MLVDWRKQAHRHYATTIKGESVEYVKSFELQGTIGPKLNFEENCEAVKTGDQRAMPENIV